VRAAARGILGPVVALALLGAGCGSTLVGTWSDLAECEGQNGGPELTFEVEEDDGQSAVGSGSFQGNGIEYCGEEGWLEFDFEFDRERATGAQDLTVTPSNCFIHNATKSEEYECPVLANVTWDGSDAIDGDLIDFLGLGYYDCVLGLDRN